MPSRPTVALLWLELGLDVDNGVFSRLKLLGRASRVGEFKLLPRGILERSWLLRLLTELPRVSPPGDCTLHLLFTLSDRFIIALWTNPPIPLVGDIGRSILSGEMRPWEGDIARERVEIG